MLLLSSAVAFSQTDTTQPPYKRFPGPPSFQLLLGDSATVYTKSDLPKNKALLLMVFSPECSHCQRTAEEFVQRKEALKDVHIVMATLHSISQMNAFAEQYSLKAMPNVVLGKDSYFILPGFYGIRNLPYLALYDRKGNLIQTDEGALPVTRIIELFEKAK